MGAGINHPGMGAGINHPGMGGTEGITPGYGRNSGNNTRVACRTVYNTQVACRTVYTTRVWWSGSTPRVWWSGSTPRVWEVSGYTPPGYGKYLAIHHPGSRRYTHPGYTSPPYTPWVYPPSSHTGYTSSNVEQTAACSGRRPWAQLGE